MDYNGQDIDGLGPLSYEAQRGFYLHPSYANTPEREPLGVLDAWMWAREFKNEAGVRDGVKESQRWLESYQRLAEQAKQMPQTRLVNMPIASLTSWRYCSRHATWGIRWTI